MTGLHNKYLPKQPRNYTKIVLVLIRLRNHEKNSFETLATIY